MEPIAVNRLTVDRALFAEGQAAIFSRKRQKMLLYCGLVFLAFGLILLAIQMRFPVASALSFPALLSGVIVVIWALTLPKTELRRKYNAFRRKNGEVSPRTVTCYRSFLTVETPNHAPIQIDYPDIREHRFTDRLLILICSDHTGVMLARDGFDAGSADGVLAAIDRAREEAAMLAEM